MVWQLVQQAIVIRAKRAAACTKTCCCQSNLDGIFPLWTADFDSLLLQLFLLCHNKLVQRLPLDCIHTTPGKMSVSYGVLKKGLSAYAVLSSQAMNKHTKGASLLFTLVQQYTYPSRLAIAEQGACSQHLWCRVSNKVGCTVAAGDAAVVDAAVGVADAASAAVAIVTAHVCHCCPAVVILLPLPALHPRLGPQCERYWLHMMKCIGRVEVKETQHPAS